MVHNNVHSAFSHRVHSTGGLFTSTVITLEVADQTFPTLSQYSLGFWIDLLDLGSPHVLVNFALYLLERSQILTTFGRTFCHLLSAPNATTLYCYTRLISLWNQVT